MIIRDEPCPSCTSRGNDTTGNHLIVFSNGNKYCNRCSYFEPASGTPSMITTPSNSPSFSSATTAEHITNTYQSKAIPDRGIKQHATERYGVKVAVSEVDGTTVTDHYYPVHKKDKLTGYKHRVAATKQFKCIGDCKEPMLFGSTVTPQGGKRIYVTEGELDCLSLFQYLKETSTLPDWNPSVVSLPTGSSAAGLSFQLNYEYLDSFEEIVLVFDQDEAGKKAVDEAALVLPHKTFIAKYSLNDPNEMILSGRGEELKWAVLKHAKKYQPDNIINGADTWEAYKNATEATCYPYPEEYTELNKMTYGIRLGSIVTVTSGTGSGKTQWLRELKYHYYKTTPWKIADIALEEGVGDTVGGLMSLHLNKRLHLPDVQVPEAEERAAHNYLFSSNRWSFYDHFGGMDDTSLFNKLRFFAATGHKLIFLDHLSIIVSEYAAAGDERQRIDTIMTKLAKLAKEMDICIVLVVHLRKTGTDGKSFEEGATPSLDDLRGSGSLKQLSWDIIALSRNQQHPETYCANTSLLTVLKCRFTGRTGSADHLHFSDTTGRMSKVSEPPNYEYNPKDKQSKVRLDYNRI